MENKLLTEIKDEYAREKGYEDFYTWVWTDGVCGEDIDTIATRYAEAQTKELREAGLNLTKNFSNYSAKGTGSEIYFRFRIFVRQCTTLKK